jgi:ketosteroid isomerase-like protein
MYKATVRAMIRRSVRRLNEGDYRPSLAVYAPDATLTFPGNNSWSRQFRSPQADREPHPTHRGRDEIEAFLKRYVGQGIQMEVEDILVNGPPWNTRVAVRVHDWVNEGGVDVYTNRAVLFATMRWGRITTHEDYEDTERSAAFDRYSATTTASATSTV